MPYRSQGTVSWGTGAPGIWVNFVPHGDYLVKDGGRSYAVFLPDGDDESCIRKQCEDENGNPSEIQIYPLNLNQDQNLANLQVSEMLIWTGARSAAMTRSRVQVEVDFDDNGPGPHVLKLTGIQTAI